MRAVVQRVGEASVSVDGAVVSRIGRGLLVLAGLSHEDDNNDLLWMAEKILGLRVFPDEEGRMNRDLREAGGALMLVSQFTLMGDTRKGKRPSYAKAMEPEKARRMFDEFVGICSRGELPVETGVFQAMMQVSSINDGPVTILLDSKKTF